MKAVGRIGVLIPEIVASLDYELLYGIHAQAKKLGYDVLVFTDTFNAITEMYHTDYISGQENIYKLAMNGQLDGILFAAEHFHTTIVREYIYSTCQTLHIPCLVLEQENDIFPFVNADQSEYIRQLTDHLIREHNCRRLYFLSGLKDSSISKKRMDGFCQAMKENDLPVDDSMIFYGDFWREKPYQLGVNIASGMIPKPDAIVCASDYMAVTLCKALIENGIRVPEEIAVTGYDGDWTALINEPRITTVAGRETELGQFAVCRLHEMITGAAYSEAKACQYFYPGTSCGCSVKYSAAMDPEVFSMQHYVEDMLNRYFERKTFMAADYVTSITNAETPEQLIKTIDSLSYVLHRVEWFDICLCEDWMFDFEDPEKYRKEGFSDRIHLAFSKRPSATIEDSLLFSAKDILPVLQEAHEPLLIVLTSLHHKDQIFGYIAMTYKNALDISADAHYINWCDAIAGGFNNLQKQQYHSYIRQQLEALSVIDPDTGFYNKRGLMEQLPDFRSRFTRNNQDYMCMLISYIQKDGSSVQFTHEPDLMIANALRLSSNEEELLCRLQDNVFAVILPVSCGSTDKSAQLRLMQLEEKIRYMQGSVLQLQLPELVTDYSPMQFDKISKAGSFIEERQQSILQKAEAAALTAGSYRERIQRLRRDIHAVPQNDWNIPDISRNIGISTSHFQRIYKSVFGIGFKDDLITARMEKAKNLLRNTDMRVQEVAYACGYNNLSHFMRQFKDRMGVTALQYKQEEL
ncbi:MAG: substrate-binding domain-containing protein [Oscillospiraceae bacterium]|nr:substrate-binding domain-containing protein [Oscillospiraceae bacterium]